MAKEEVKQELVEPLGEITGTSTQSDIVNPSLVPGPTMLDQIKDILSMSDNKNQAIMDKVADISSSISQV